MDAGQELNSGQEVLVEFEQVLEFAKVLCNKDCPKKDAQAEEMNVKFIRLATEKDLAIKENLKSRANEYLMEAQDKALRHNLDMKIFDAEFSFDEKKLTFYFAAEGRIDFRSLVSDMVGSFRKIIRLQQVGPRDEAKYFGGLGKCGREICCKSFLNNMEEAALDMSQVQDIYGIKASKFTGCCGKIMCCLSYEAETYQKIKAQMPKIGSAFKSAQAEGTVVAHNVVENKIVVEQKDGKRIEVDR